MRFSDISVIFSRSIQHGHTVDAVALTRLGWCLTSHPGMVPHFIEESEEGPQTWRSKQAGNCAGIGLVTYEVTLDDKLCPSYIFNMSSTFPSARSSP